MMGHTLSASRPMTETMPEGRASAAACMLSPRIFTNFTPSSNLQHFQRRSWQGRIVSYFFSCAACQYMGGPLLLVPGKACSALESSCKGQRSVFAQAEPCCNISLADEILHGHTRLLKVHMHIVGLHNTHNDMNGWCPYTGTFLISKAYVYREAAAVRARLPRRCLGAASRELLSLPHRWLAG